MLNAFQKDILANSLAVLVLLWMVASLGLVLYNFVMGNPSQGRRWPTWSIPLLAALGTGVSIYLTFIETTKSEAFCGPIGNCNSVQQSPYATLFGFLPVGVLGLLGYLAILVLSIGSHYLPPNLRRLAWLSVWVMAIFGVLFSIYLTFLEPFVIGATCMWCLSSAVLITLILWAATPLAKLASTSESEDEELATA